MHLMLASPGAVAEGGPVDLGQDPAPLIVISAADTEIAALAEARATMADAGGSGAPELRLASLLHLSHPASVDQYLDRTATKAKLVVARVLGGEGYWRYGLEQFAARLGEAGVDFAALPGDDRPDLGLARVSTVSGADYDALWAYLVEGGPQNAQGFLAHAQAMIAGAERPEPARPLLRAGVYWPGEGGAGLAAARAAWAPGAPVVPIVFYRALLQGAGLNPINRLVRVCLAEGLAPLPIYVASLKDPVSAATVAALFDQAEPAVILNATSFQAGPGVLDRGVPVLQVILASGGEADWAAGTRGLAPRDVAMNVALPEIDGRIITRAISFKGEAYFDAATQCPITAYRAVGDRVAFVVALAAAWARLAATPRATRRVALLLANYPNRDGRLANGVGLNTPQSVVDALGALGSAGYAVAGAPATAAELMARILAAPTNWLTDRASRVGGVRLGLDAYRAWYGDLPWEVRVAIETRWGTPEHDPFVTEDAFALSVLQMGHVVVGVQPARGYNLDPAATYHSPDLVPPHNYLAFYAWLRTDFRADAIVQFGKHGNLEWLPGKALALSATCLPEAVLGPVPVIYPFIVNDPGEGTAAKRRSAAVILDHLTPPLTRADSHGAMAQLEGLLDEYAQASGVDPRRLGHLKRDIDALVSVSRLDLDAGIAPGMGTDEALLRLDTYLCEVKEAQIRDGLHVFGQSPVGRLEVDLLVALVRVPRGPGAADASLIRALAEDLGLGFDPLDCVMGAAWEGPQPEVLAGAEPWRTVGDTVERLEALAARLVAAIPEAAAPGGRSAAVLEWVAAELRPRLRACGPGEAAGLIAALDGGWIAPGPSGAPTRGRPDVLPTGRNFHSVDPRAIPTPTAARLGWASAALLVERHLQDQGDWPRALVVTAWGTANMRTGGDDIAQALALMGVRPVWEPGSGRVTGYEIIPLAHLDRPRVDVTLRVSGFFRDAFAAQIALVDAAARAVQALDEPADQNPAAARYRAEVAALQAQGVAADEAGRRAGYRVFGSKPGAYGAGLQALIDEGIWGARADLGASYLDWGGYAYGDGAEGAPARAEFAARLGQVDAVVQNQDNREHDLLDSDDYYQFEGGAAAAVESLRGVAPVVYHPDHSRPERPVIRTLEEEIGRVVRSRVTNPKWLAGVMRHGYKGAFEIAASVDYLFAFAATTHAVRDHHFDLVHAAVLEDAGLRDWIAEVNPAALAEIAARLDEAIARGLWHPASNSAAARIAQARGAT